MAVPAITRSEVYGFLGINLVMSYHKLPSWTYYWNNDHDFSVPFLSTIMTRKRFAQILSNIHVNDNSCIPEDNQDKLYNIRPFIDALNENYVKLYSPSKRQSVDESMILFKGRHSIKQYNPMKPIKRGYKLWVRADTDGYISKFEVYQGKASHACEPSAADNNESEGFGLGEQVVHSRDLFHKHQEVYFDNYFSSVALMEYLRQNGVHAAGTVRLSRKGLPVGMNEKLSCGEYDYRVSKGGVVFIK